MTPTTATARATAAAVPTQNRTTPDISTVIHLQPALTAPTTTSATRPQRGDAGASRTGLLLMPDEARRIDDKLNELGTVVTRIDTKLDMITGTQNDHEKRLRVLEAWRLVQIGAALASGAGAGALVSKLMGAS